MMLKVAYSPIFNYGLPDGHRFPMLKYELLPEQLLREGTLSTAHFFEPDPFTTEELALTHTSEYIAKLEELRLSRREIRDIGFPVRKELVQRGKHIARGSYECALHALKNQISINIAGGTHHAFADRGEGFCVLNDFALAAHHLLIHNYCKKILIVDLDVHQGNGTARIFKNDDRVYTFSMHGKSNYPLRKEVSDCDVALEDGCADDYYLYHLRRHLPKIIQLFEPDLVLYLAGVDVLKSDRLGRLHLSRAGCKARDAYVFKQCKSNAIPVCVSMGGGYSEKISDIVEAHANTYRLAQEMYF